MPKVNGWWESRRRWVCFEVAEGERLEGGWLEGKISSGLWGRWGDGGIGELTIRRLIYLLRKRPGVELWFL